MHRLPISVAAAALAVAAAVPATQAQDSVKPRPDCNGVAYVDEVGDATTPTPGLALGSQGPAPQLDIVQSFLTTKEGITRANLVIDDLTKEIAGAGSSNEYYAYFTDDAGTVRYVNAIVLGDGSVTYEQGTQDGNLNTTAGATEGQMFEGKNGVVSIVIPDSIGAVGSNLKALSTSTVLGYDAVAVRSLPQSDAAPDNDADAKNFVAQACTAPPAPAPAVRTSLPVVPVGSMSARKLSLKLRAGSPVTKLVANVKRGKKVVASGKLSKLSGTKTLNLTRKSSLKKGSYRLELSGVDASGAKLKAAYRLKVTK